MIRFLSLATLLLISACGHKTALVRPSGIPEYERKRQEKIDKYAPYDARNATPKSE